MKKLCVLVFACLGVACACASVIYNDAIDEIDPGIGDGGGTLDIVSVEVSNTDSNLVFALTVNGSISITDFGKFLIGIATGGSGTTNGNGWNRPINLDSPVGGMDYWIGSWVDSGGGAELWSYDGASWSGPGAVAGYTMTPGVQSLLTFTVARTALGLTNTTDTFYFDAYTSGGGGSDSAVDALSNPNVSITAWDEAYTSRTNDTGLSSYTLVNFVTADVSPSNGPFAGGNVVLVTNAVPAIGDGSDITNVVLGGVGTTTITGQGANWVAFVAPPASSAGVKDVEIQSTSVGDTTLANAYTVNPAGEIGGTNFVIRWTAVGDAVVPGQIDAKGANNTIYSIDYYNNNLYAGGAFTNIGGSNSYRVARHDGTNWNSMQAGVFRVANVNYIKGGPYGIYSGGYYTNIGGSYTAGGTMINDGAANAFAVGRFDGTNWNGMGHPPAVGYTGRVGLCFSPTINGYVNFIEPYTGNTVIAGGYFTNSDYRAAGLYYIAKYDGAGWTNLQQGFRNVPLAAAYDRARDHLYVGGSFTNHNPTNTSVHMNFIARWNGTHWTNMARGLGARVTCMAVHPSSGELYVGGWLTNYNNADGQAYPANYVAKWDPVSESFTNVGSGFNNWVYSLKFDTNGTLYAGGAFTNTYITTEPDKSAPQLAVTRIARWNGTHWTNMGGGCSDTVLSLAVNTNNNDLYASGHFRIAYQDDQSSTNTWYVARYGADGIVSAGVEPSSGSVTGGFEVVITGDHLGGGDITNVTICGASAASIESQSATQVVVVAGSGAPGLGDVRVYSTSYGETTKSDAFTYLGGVMTLLGTNGASITSGEAPSLAKGTDFGLLSEGVSATNTLTVTNGGNETLTIEGWTTNGLSDFVVVSGPDSVAAGATADFVVAFHPIAPGPSTASVQIAHNAMGSPFALNLEAQSGKLDQTITFAPIAAQATNAALGLAATASSGLEVSFSVGAGPGNLADGTNLTFSGPGSVSVVASQAGDGVYNPAPDVTNIIHVYALTAYAGPYEGGNTLTITNGYFGTITNVLVGGIVATIEDVGTNWARIVVPSVGSYGMKDIVVQTSDETDTTLAQAYKVNPPVMPLIASEPFDYEVTRWDTNVPGHYDGGTGWGTNRWEVDLTPQPGHPVPKAAIFGTNDYEPYEPQMAYAWGHGGRLYRDLGATLDTSPGAKIYFSLDMYTPETADSHVSGSIGGFGVSIESQAAKPGELIIYTPQNNSWNEPKPVELTGLYGSWHRMTAEIEFFATGSVIRAWIDASQEADPHEVLASTCTTFSASRFYIAHWGDSGYALADNIIIGTNFSQVALPLAVLGTNGALITSGEEPTEAKGTRFPTLLLNYSQTNVFSITNSGAETITLTDWATNGAGAGAFTALDLPSVIAPWSVSHFSVIFHPTNAGSFSASLSFSNNSALPARSISLAGACAEVFAVPSNGPYAGDYEVSLWHGYGSVFTNVIVGAAAGVAPTEAAVDRVTFVMPTALTAGPMDITLQRDGDTDVVMTNVFTYDAAWFVVAPSNGPYAGGTAVSVTHGLNSVITNVVVRGVDVPTTGADTNGFSLVMPAVEFAGLVNFTMQRADAADFVLTNAYRYNAAVINVAPNSGRISGGDVVTVTHDLNGVVTNVLVGGVEVVPDSASTTNFVLTMPSAATAGAVNFVLQRDGVADFTINNAYTYNPAGFIGYTDPDAWMEVAGMPEARLHLAAATLSNRIYAIGGYDSDLSPRDTVYAFDGTNWTVETALPGTMTEIGATSDGTNIWLAGGGDALMRFDGVSWATVDNLTDARYQPFMVIFSNRPVVVSGGVGAVTEYDGTSLNELAQLPGGHDLLGGAGGVLGDFLIAAGGGYATAASTSAWRYDGSAWSSIAGLPAARYYMATAVWRDRVYALGGLNSDASGENTVYRFDGTNWTAGAALPYHLYAGAGTVLHGALYHVGGMSVELGVMTNVLKYVPGEEYSGVAPAFGNLAGGYPVTIRGENFGNGSDVTNVMICGVAAQGILSQSATQIVVLAGASPVMTNGDVVVYSTSYGETVRSNVFTYIYLSSWHGPYVGGNTVTLTNIVAIGDNDITNVLVGGIAATVDGQGADWVRFVLGPATNAGRSDIVVQSTSLGETVFAGSYTYNTPGVIGWRDPDRAWEQTVPLSYRVTRTAMVNYSNALYVIGGRLNFMNGTTYTNVCRFDGTNWAFVAGLPAGAMNIGAAVWDGAIYAAGNNATTVYRFDGTAWTTVTPLPAARMNPVLTVFSNQLHVVGGAFGAAVYIYDGTNWSEKAATPVAANMESVPTGVLGDFLYVGSGTYFGETNAWRFNGTDWTATVGLPKALPRTASVVADERLYAIGGMYETAVASSDTLFFNGTNWQSSSSLPYTLFLGAAAEMDRALYAIGGANSGRSNVLRMALGDTHFGVSPSNGVLNGGFEVVIGGLHLGDGNDVTNVTLCGVSVSSIQSQTATQIVVVAGASGSVGIGDVHVYSTSYGDTVKSNAFEYLKGNQSITFAPLGVQAVSDTVGLSATASSGLPVTFATNGGPAIITGGTNLTFTGLGSVSIVASQAGDGTYHPAPDVTNFVRVYALSAYAGPYVGGNSITITNGILGDGADITNVTVGGVAATITGQGETWVTITVPEVGSAGVKDIVIQSASQGNTTLANAYTVNPAGSIEVPTIMMEYLISFTGTNGTFIDYHMNDLYVTNYTPFAPAGTVYTYLSATNTEYVELAATNRGDLVKNDVWMRLDGFIDSYNGGWNDMAGGLWWLSTNVGQWFVFREEFGDSYVTITNLPGTNYHVEVINAYPNIITLRYNQQLHPGIWQPGEPRDIGNWGTNIAVWQQPRGGGNWFSPTNTFYWRDRYIVYSNTVPQDRAMTLVLWDTNGQPCNVLNAMRIRGEEPLGVPIDPPRGSWTGGYPVVINGFNLGDGSDITNVTLCGIPAMIVGQTNTSVSVNAGAYSASLLGDVRVYSVSFGETVMSNAFTYLASDMGALGTNGASFADGEAASLTKGNAFYATPFGAARTNTFSLTNSGNDVLSIDPSDLSDPSDFSISGVPATVDIGAVSNFSVTYTPTTIGNHSAFVVFTNNTPDSPFTLNLAGACFGLSTNVGPYAGGNTITITNGYFGAITNVLVDGIDVSAIVDSGVNWVNVVMPLLGAAGTVDITIQTSDNGAITLANAYTYNPTGEIGEYGPVEYRVYSGFSMSQGYYTNTSPDGTYLWNYYRGGWMELRSTNEVAGGAWMRLNGWNGGFAGGGWDTSLGGYDWIGSNTALYVLDSYSSSIHTNYIEVTNLVGGSYQVDVVSSFQDDEYTQTMTMVSGVYQPGDLADNGNYGNWPSGGNTNAGLNLRPYYIYQTRTNYVTWTNAQTTDKALSVVFTKQETEGNLFNNMRIRGLGVIASGVAPSSGFWTGGYPVVISGTNLCNGNVSDVTNVTLAGTAASIDSVSGNTQIVVIVSASPAASGDVVIHSISHGTTIKSNAFTYLEPRMLALGTNGAAMASDAAAGSANGTDFGDLIVGVGALTNTFSITNSGNTALTISGVSTSGAGASSFSLQLSSFSLPAGAAEDFSVVFEPDGGDAKVAALNFANDSTTGVYVVNLAGFGLGGGIALGTNQLAYTATYNGTDPVDQTLMMTNVGVSGFTYTNLHVYGGNASNWLAVAPGAGTVALASSVELTNAVSISGLNAGLYSCGVQITAPDATNSPQSYMVELTVNKADQTISFPHPGAQETTNVVAIAPTATSGLTVDVSVVSGPGLLTSPTSPTSLTFTNAGTVVITASQAGDTNWNTAASVTHTIAVTKAVAPVMINNLSQVYDGTARSVTASTTPGGLTVNFTYEGNTWAPTNAGSYAVTGVVSDIMYQGWQTGTLVVAKADQTITFPAIASQTYTSHFGLAATADSGFGVSFVATDGPGSITDDTNLTFTATGVVSIVASQAGDANWNAAPPLTNTFMVNKADQVITFPAIADQETTNVTPISATALSTLGVNFTVVSGPASLTSPTSPTSLTYTNAGAVIIAAHQPGSNYWNAAPSVTNTFNVIKAVGSVMLSNLTQVYTSSPLSPTSQTSPTGLIVHLTFDGLTNLPVNVGAYTVIGAMDDPIYQSAATGTFTIVQATQTIVFAQLPDMIITDTWGLSATGGASTNPVTFAVLSGPAGIAGGTNLTFTNVGEVQIIANQAGDINYIVAPTVTNVFNVSPTTPVISTPTVSNILAQTASLGGTIDSTNGAPVTERGVNWWTDRSTNIYSASEAGAFGTGAYSLNVTGIVAGITNFFEAYAVNVSGTVYSATSEFLARPDAPEITGPTNIQVTGFYANWNAAEGALTYYLDVSETNSFDTFVPGYENLSLGDANSASVTGLGSVVWYYYRVRAENAQGFSTNSATRTVGLMMDLVIAGAPVEHDSPAPLDYGTHRIIVETMTTNSVTTPADESNGARYVCTGWTGTGDVPTNGTTNTVTFLFTTDSTLTWQWKTQYLLTQESTGGYVYGLVSGWQDQGWIFDLTARPTNGYLFAHWLTNGSYAGDADVFRVLADAPKQISAIFAPTVWDVNVTGTTDRTNWEIIGANAFGTFEVCNPSDSGTLYLDKFLFAITPDTYMHIRYPDGTSPAGQEYVDVTGEVQAKLALVGNGDQIMDPGECVTLDPIEFLGKNPAFLDTPRFYSKGLPDMSGVDTDGDGIPNTWEDGEGLNPNNPLDGGEDQDGDGVPSEQEYIADTNPFDADSYLHIRAMNLLPGAQQVEWIGGSSVVQYLEWNPAMSGDAWSVITTNTPPTPVTNLFDDTFLDIEGYYRIRAIR